MEQNIIYIVQAAGFGTTIDKWENVAAFSTPEGAEAYENNLRGKCSADYEPMLRTITEALNPAFPHTQ